MPAPNAVSRSLRAVAKAALAVGGILAAEIFEAAYRPELPSFADHVLDGTFGDPTAPRLRLAFVGDSTITGPGVEPIDATWPRRVAHHFAADHHVDLVVTAVGGSKAVDVLTTQVPAALEARPDVVVLSVGGNDALRGTPIAGFEARYGIILDRLTAVAPVVACGIGDFGTIPRLPPLARGLARVRSRAVDRAIARAAAGRSDVRKTDSWGARWRPFATDPELWADDLFHASARGHALYAEATIPLIEDLLHLGRPGGGGSSQ